MGATIRLLEDALVDQIAAGEVIERPANLVKELLENSIDARSTVITVAVEDGGRGHVRVSDDGVGMSPEDAALCIERHATSKIASFDDLVSVATLGFRGEALPSIGAVSKMSIVTRRREDLEGTRVVVEGGTLVGISPHGCPPGTTIDVDDLFYNVPARKKFLRARQTETSRIMEICQRTALIQPELRLVVSSDGRRAREYLPTSSLTDRAYQVFGDVGLLEISAEREGVMLEAVMAPIELARPGARHLFLYVNGRPILDRRLARAVAFAYGDRLAPGQYPRGVISLHLPREDVDVNAHPQKTEVRFKRAAHLVDLVTRMLAARLPTSSKGDAFWQARMGPIGPTQERDASDPSSTRSEPSSGVAERESDYPARTPNGLYFIAQLRNRYLVCESEDHLYVLDRQRAQQAIHYDALREAASRGELSPQTLLFPDRVELGSTREQLLERHGALLHSLGFEWSALGEGTYAVRSVPALVGTARATSLFEAALDAVGPHMEDPTVVLRALAQCAAAPNGEPLDEAAARDLVARVELDRDLHQQSIVARVPLSGTTAGVEP